MERIQDDIIVIGGGIAGIVASLELLSAGRSVTLLDRDIEENFGGLAKESFGGLFVVDSAEQRRSGIRDTPDLALRDWLAFGEFTAAEVWPRRWAEAYVHGCNEEVYCWLKKLGISFMPTPNWAERGQFTAGNSLPRFHMIWGTGQELMRCLIEKLRNHPCKAALTLKFDYRVESLTTEGGRIAGCQGTRERNDNDTPFEARCNALIIATGGINGDLDRVRRHWHADWGHPPEKLLNGSHRYADGKLHDAVEAVHGQITHLDRMWNYAAGVHHWLPRKPDHGLSLIPPRSALWLNWCGERIGPQPLVSGFDTRELVTRICHEKHAHSWQILNHKIALRELAVSGAEFNPSIRDKRPLAFLRTLAFGNHSLVDELTRNCPDFVIAHSLNELTDKMNVLQGDNAIDPTVLTDAVTSYDDQIQRGPRLHNDEQLRRIAHLRRWPVDRLRTCRFQKIVDPHAMPLIAIREFIISRKSLGGIQTDLDCRVLDVQGSPIPGLHAIGEAAGFGGGGMHGLRALEGTFLGGCIFSARRVARSLISGAEN